MQIFFAGVESPSHLQALKTCGVERVAVSINNLARHTSKYVDWASQARLGGLDWVCYADSPTCPVDPALELLAGAEVQPEWVSGPVRWAEDTWIKDSDLGFLPIWDGHDASVLRTYAEDYEGVVLPDSVVDNGIAVRTAKAALPTMGTLGGLTGRSKGVDRFDMLVSSAWWAVQKHGETQVWTGNRLVRLNADDKHLKRRRYADAIEALGCDVSAVLADDPLETVRCAVLSWMSLERFLNSMGNRLPVAAPVVTSAPPAGTGGTVIPINGVASAPVQTRQRSASGVALTNLPTINSSTVTTTTQDEDGNTQTEHHPTIEVGAGSARQCSTCQLSAACPSFSPGSACAYQIPVVIKTKDQRQAVMRALTEVQVQRIMMQNFSEQVMGAPDPLVGREIDRFFQMLKAWKEIEEHTSSLRIQVDAKEAGNMGMISRLFGEEAGLNARVLDRPILVDELIEEAQMVDDDV